MNTPPNKLPCSVTGSKRWPAAIYLCFIAIGIPWYWPSNNHLLIAGMPAWVVVAIGVSFLASVFTAWLLWRPWPNESDAD